MRTKSIKTDKSKSVGNNLDTVKVCNKKLLIAIPSWTGVIDSLAVEGFMQLIANVSHLDIKIETYTTILKRLPIVTARNKIVNTAIENNCDYIFWIDDDMVIKPDINLIEKLLAHDKDIVAPLFFAKAYPFIPMIFKRKMYAGKYCVYDNIVDYPKGLLKVDGVGFGCVLTKVEMFKKLTQPYFWVNEVFGEDLFFCENATRAGIEIYCDTTIDVGHIGEPIVSWEVAHTASKQANYDYMKAKKIKDDKAAGEFYANLHKNIGKKVDIIIPCYHNVDITKDAIESIIKLTEDINYRIIAVIDGYDKELLNYFKSLKLNNLKIVYHKQSLGFIKSTNHGIEYVRKNADYVLFLNNDIVIQDPKWLINMVNSFDDSTGAVGPISNYVMGVQSERYNSQLPLIHYAKFLIGFCYLIRKDVLDKVGVLDERFGIGMNEDLDLSIRIRKAGYKLKINRGVFVHHLGSKSLSLVLKDFKETEDLTRAMLIEKWGKETVDGLFTMLEEFIINGEA